MPGFITHYICGQAAVRALPLEAREIVKKYACLYNIGAQGPDIFFYYLPGLVRKRTRGIGVRLHREKVGIFLKELTDTVAQTADTEERHILFAYTAGYLTHYSLDAVAHPYVYARTGENGTIKQSVDHRKFETAIDVLMLKLMSGEKPSDYRLWQLVRADARQTRVAAEAVSTAIRSTYARDVRSQDVYKAMAYMVQLTRLLQSRNGRRKHFMELAENLTIGAHLVSSIIHTQDVEDDMDYLNLEKSPWNTQAEDNDSFMELYQRAVTDAVDMNSLLYAYMRGSVPQSTVLARIGSRSLATGKEESVS